MVNRRGRRSAPELLEGNKATDKARILTPGLTLTLLILSKSGPLEIGVGDHSLKKGPNPLTPTLFTDIFYAPFLITSFLHQLSSKYSDLTPTEIRVAELVKDGKTTKEIAELLNSSTGAIDFHRNNLRKKLGLRNTKTNLRSFLLALT